MKLKPILIICIVSLVLCISSCKMYYIPVDSFKQQFAGLSQSRTVETKSPYGSIATYNTYPMDVIKCVDDKGNAAVLPYAPSIEIRITTNDDKKTVFYFDLLTVTDSTVIGVRSRLIPTITKTIQLKDITKIEVQDGQKKYRYVQR